MTDERTDSTQQQSSNMEELPNGKSYWDKLPKELKDMVFDFTPPLTRCLNDRIKPDKLDDKTKLDIWLEAFDIDWQGKLSFLPDPPLTGNHKLRNKHLARVKSRSMYERLCKRFPDFDKDDEYYEHLNYSTKKINSYFSVKPNGSSLIIEDLLLIHIPMHHMWLDLIQSMIDKYPHAIANECIKYNHIDLLKQLVDTKKIKLKDMIVFYPTNHIKYRAISYVAFHGNLEILKMLHDDGCYVTNNAMDYAAIKGHLHVVKFLHENKYEGCSTDAIDYAARNGHFEVVKWLLENRNEGFTHDAIAWASKKGHNDIVEFLNKNRSKMNQ